jgi:hypothetical protein
MARATLRTKQGTRVHSTGNHTARRTFDVTPQPEREVTREQADDSLSAMFDTMMRANRAAGL